MERLLDGRVAVVTGAAQGIGFEIARTLHQHGARVVLADLDEQAAARAATDIAGDGSDCAGVACNVTSEDDVRAVVSGPSTDSAPSTSSSTTRASPATPP